MIAIARTAEPPHLTANQAVWTAELCNERARYYLALAAHTADPTLPLPKKPTANSNRYGHSAIKAALSAMFASKCCYCEAWIEHTSPRHVEHFRPASVFPALAYQWDNLLYACFRCNSTHKSDKFPLIATNATPSEDPVQPCSRDASEAGLMLNPCQDDPTAFFTFENGLLVATHPRGIATRDICGLNRGELVRHRRKQLKRLQLILEAYLEAQETGKTTLVTKYANGLREFCTPEEEYAGMARAELLRNGIDWTKLPVAEAA